MGDKMKKPKETRGITLIELLVVISIVGILAAIAVPLYTNYMQRARRADAKSALEQLRAAQEMRRSEKGGYSTDSTLAELRTSWGVSGNPVGDYNVSFTGTLNTNSFTAQAVPFTSRQLSDGNLYINYLGQKWDKDNVYYPNGRWAK